MDDLEAALWQLLKRYMVTCADPVRFIDEIKALATAYAAGDADELTAARRAVLFKDGGTE